MKRLADAPRNAALIGDAQHQYTLAFKESFHAFTGSRVAEGYVAPRTGSKGGTDG
jgi:hypothetical protein